MIHSHCAYNESSSCTAEIAQLGERQTEDLKVPGSIPGRGISLFPVHLQSRVAVLVLEGVYESVRMYRRGKCPLINFYSCDGRVVKAFDLKSNGIFPRRFESYSQRTFTLPRCQL